jgi:shikimate kinase
LAFICGLKLFWRFLAHHQELTTALAVSGFTYCRFLTHHKELTTALATSGFTYCGNS